MSHTPPNIGRVASDTGDPAKVLRNLTASCGQLPVRAIVTWGGQVGSARRANIAVYDSLSRPVTGQFSMLVWIAEEEGGGPASSQIVTLTSGTSLFDLDAGFIFLATTDANGQLAFDVEGSTGYRWVGVTVLGGVFGGSATWA